MGQMSQKKLGTKLWLYFLSINLSVPAISFLFNFLTEGDKHFQSFLRSFYYSPLIFGIGIIAFYFLTRKLQLSLDAIQNPVHRQKKDQDISYINAYPFRSAFLLGAVNLFVPTLTEFLNLYNGIVFSWQQVLFFWICDIALALIAGSVFFYFVKIELYPVIEIAEYKPIRIYHKILIPIMSLILFMILVTCIGVYQIGVSRHEEFMRQIMSLNLEEASLNLNTTLEKLLIQTDSYTRNDTVKAMNPIRVQEYLRDLQEEKEDFVKTFFISDMNGDTINSLGFKFNVKKGKVFQKILATEKFAISNPVKSLDDGSVVLVCAVPIKSKKKLIGNFGMTFAIEKVGDALAESSDGGKYDFVMYSEEGKIVYHKKYEYLNFDLDKEFDDNLKFKGFPSLIKENFTGINKFNRGFHELVFENTKVYGMTIELPKFNSRLLMFIPKNVFYSKLNNTLLQISGFILVATLLVTLSIRSITNKLTIPIQNTIAIFQRISNGDLTVQASDYVPDEFGEIQRYLRNLIHILSGTVSLIQKSSRNLADTSILLSSTTQKMAQNSGEQVTSIHASSEYVKNISKSVEIVAANSKSAYLSSQNTFKLMEELLSQVNDVNLNTEKAKMFSDNSSGEAEKGNQLMDKAILGMDNIHTSTKKISEIVGLISDISKQVNLLALNAAIEAARAGDYGHGFTVVADEISKLAEKTSRSAKSIREYIAVGLEEVSLGKEYVDDTAKSLSIIIQNTKKNHELIEQITHSSKVQAEFTEKVLIAVKQVMEMTEEISRSTEEQTSTSQELSTSVEFILDLTKSLANGSENIASTSLQILEQSKSLNQLIEFFHIEEKPKL
jgi:methyl-accepting chemotaxis protein